MNLAKFYFFRKSTPRESGCNYRFSELNVLKIAGIVHKIPVHVSVNFQAMPMINTIVMARAPG